MKGLELRKESIRNNNKNKSNNSNYSVFTELVG